MNSVVKVQLLIVVLLGTIGQQVLSVRHTLIWDRFWLNDNIPQLTLPVLFGDQLGFFCQVNGREPRYENLIGLRDEQEANECRTKMVNSTAVFINFCQAHGFDMVIDVTNAPRQATDLFRFEAGLAYFTSFSTGSLDSARDSRTEGGACTSMPPLKLTVSVAADMEPTSSLMPTSSMSAVLPTPSISSSSSDGTTSTMMVATPTPSGSPNNTNTDPTGPIADSSEQLAPSCYTILSFVTVIYFLTL